MNMLYQEITIKNPGILVSKLPDHVFQDLLQSCNTQIEKKDIGKTLKRNLLKDDEVQGIEENFHINIPDTYSEYLKDFASAYINHYELKGKGKPAVDDQWINLQKKFEYRPLHAHGHGLGVLSFVTYIKIPYILELEDQYKNHNKRAKVFRNGRIEFFCSSFTGTQLTKTLDIDSTWEGSTLLFLSSMTHMVYPFYTSDEYRISVAGNINLYN